MRTPINLSQRRLLSALHPNLRRALLELFFGWPRHKEANDRRIPWGLFALSLIAVIAANILTGQAQENLSQIVGRFPVLLASLVTALTAMVLVYRRRFEAHRLFGPVLTAVLSSSVLASQVADWLGSSQGILGVLSAIVILPLSWHLKRWKDALSPPHVLYHEEAEERALKPSKPPVEALILFLSPPTWVPSTFKDRPARFPPPSKLPDPPHFKVHSEEIVLSGRLHPPGTPIDAQCDIERMEPLGRHPWQQLLRSIQPHAPQLRHLILFGSKGPPDARAKTPGELENQNSTDGSSCYLSTCEEFLRPYLPSSSYCVITRVAQIDFENPKELIETVRQQFEGPLRAVPRERIALDITSGQKVNSLVGGLLTLDDQVLVQYVQTGGKKKTRLYDIRYPDMNLP